MRRAGDSDHARVRRGEQRREKKSREREMAEVVGAELQLEAIGR